MNLLVGILIFLILWEGAHFVFYKGGVMEDNLKNYLRIVGKEDFEYKRYIYGEVLESKHFMGADIQKVSSSFIFPYNLSGMGLVPFWYETKDNLDILFSDIRGKEEKDLILKFKFKTQQKTKKWDQNIEK